MTKIYYESDADLSVLDGQRVAVVGYGNQGRSWALNLRDSGLVVEVFTRADASRDQAEAEGFTAHEIEAASACDVICTLIPDDIIPELPITPEPDALWVLASGYAVAFDRIDPNCDVGMVACVTGVPHSLQNLAVALNWLPQDPQERPAAVSAPRPSPPSSTSVSCHRCSVMSVISPCHLRHEVLPMSR